MVELLDTLVLEASSQASEFESRLGHQVLKVRRKRYKEVTGRTYPWQVTNFHFYSWKCGRVWLMATVLKTVVSKGTVSSNLTVSAKLYLLSSYTGTTLNLPILQNGKRCQEEKGYRGFKRHSECLLWLGSSVWQNVGLQNQMSVVQIHPGSPSVKYASMVKLVDTRDLKSLAARCPGSTPGTRTNYKGELYVNTKRNIR